MPRTRRSNGHKSSFPLGKLISRYFTIAITLIVTHHVALVAASPAEQKKHQPGQPKQKSKRPVSEKSKLPASEKRFALVIGVGKYDDQSLSELYGDKDAKAIAQVLIQRAGFPPGQVVRLSNDQRPELQPTLENILEELSKLARRAKEDSLLLVAFSGHGGSRGGQQLILPKRAKLSTDPLLLNTMIRIDVLRQHALGKAKQVIFIVDACRDEFAVTKGTDNRNVMTKEFASAFSFDRANDGIDAFVTLFAASLGESAYQDNDKKLGYFTSALVEGLNGKAADPKGDVFLGALVSYLRRKVPELVGPDKKQTPFSEISGYMAANLLLSLKEGESEASEVRSFRFDNPQSPPEDLIRHLWSRIDAETWEEQGKNGESTRYSIQERDAVVDLCRGTTVSAESKDGKRGSLFFIPYKGWTYDPRERSCLATTCDSQSCGDLWIMARDADKPWRAIAPMVDIK